MDAKGGQQENDDPGVLRKKTSAGSNKDPLLLLWDKEKGMGDAHTLAFLGFYKKKSDDKRKLQPDKEKIDKFFGTSDCMVDSKLMKREKHAYEEALKRLKEINQKKAEEDKKKKAEEEHLRLLKGATKRKKLNKDTGCYELKDLLISYRHGNIYFCF